MCPFGLPSLTPRALAACKRRLGALGDHAALGLRHQRHDADHHLVGLRHVGGDELDAGLLQAEQEVRVAGEPVELGDDQRRAVDLAGVERLVQRRPVVVVLAALDLDVLLDQLPVAAVEEASTAARCASRPRPLSPWRLVETRR